MVRHARADYLNINYHLLSREKVALFKRHGIKICAWTVNNPKTIEYLKDLGIDGIITNYPDRL
jgi:glycerophosphoryl diester phosphodiesterase